MNFSERCSDLNVTCNRYIQITIYEYKRIILNADMLSNKCINNKAINIKSAW